VNEKLSISVFFPAYNDAECLPELLAHTFLVLPRLTPDYEVIVVNDGSTDDTRSVLEILVHRYAPHLRVVTHNTNRGYGAALRSGFAACTKDTVFYTDGDGQYNVEELEQLWKKWRPGIDVVNGYKLNRADNWLRRAIGNLYKWAVRRVFHLSIRDVDCDFRLIRRDALKRIQLRSDSGSICVELIRKLQDLGCRFAEVGVHHYPRKHGRSQFFRLKPLLATFYQLFVLYSSLSEPAS
jgi:glycosyltransferase involved in cell wall biosynthesis